MRLKILLVREEDGYPGQHIIREWVLADEEGLTLLFPREETINELRDEIRAENKRASERYWNS